MSPAVELVVVVAAAKGSPGVTTTSLALAATWPSAHGPLLLECDPSGGDLGAWFALGHHPGLVSLAAAARRTTGRPELFELAAVHAHELPGGLRVVPAPVGTEAAAGAVEVLANSPAFRMVAPTTTPTTPRPDGAGRTAVTASAPVLVDAGRLVAWPSRATGQAALLAAADLVLLVVRNDVRGLLHATAALDGLLAAVNAPGLPRPEGQMPAEGQVQAVLIGNGYPPEEVRQALGIPLAGRLPIDERAAAALSGRPVRRPTTVNRAPLLRAAARITRTVTLARISDRSRQQLRPAPPDRHSDLAPDDLSAAANGANPSASVGAVPPRKGPVPATPATSEPSDRTGSGRSRSSDREQTSKGEAS